MKPEAKFILVKNTLFARALQKSGYVVPEFLDGTSLVGFAFNDAPSLAKSFTEFVKGNETRVIKGGFLGKQLISAKQVKALADLPSLPVMRATLLRSSGSCVQPLYAHWWNPPAQWQRLSLTPKKHLLLSDRKAVIPESLR